MTEITRKRDGAKLRIRFNAETDEMCRRYLGARIRSAFLASGGREARPYSSLEPRFWRPDSWRKAFAGFVR